jgi:hypothetical protein
MCGQLITGLQAADSFLIDQQYAFEHPMLAHQVFGWSDRHFVLCRYAGPACLVLPIAACR